MRVPDAALLLIEEGFEFSTSLDVVGFRNKEGRVNYFDDWLGIVFKRYDGEIVYFIWPGTTRPGKDSLLKPVNDDGTAIVVPGKYKEIYSVGNYKGYKALKQVGSIKVYRDRNKDGNWDLGPTIQEGLFGIHIHKASFWSKIVGPYSAGCQVFQKAEDFEQFMSWIKSAVLDGQTKFNYTLLEF